MIALDVIRAKGHFNVKGTHRNTLEITKDDYLTPRGDCILGINADKALSDLDEKVKQIISTDGSYVYLVMKVGEKIDVVQGVGSHELSLSNTEKLIVRRSSFISDSTLMLRSNKAARDIRRDLIEELKEEADLTAFVIASDRPLKDVEVLSIIVNSDP